MLTADQRRSGRRSAGTLSFSDCITLAGLAQVRAALASVRWMTSLPSAVRMGSSIGWLPSKQTEHSRDAPAPPPRHAGVGGLDQSPPARGRLGHTRAGQTTQSLLHPLCRLTARRTLVSRLHPLVAGQQHPRGNPVWLDDHSRYALSVTAHRRITGPIVVEEFRNTYERQGIPYSTLTDNGMVFTTRFAGGKGGRAPSRRIGAYRVPPGLRPGRRRVGRRKASA
jgi:hypothetical protein